MNAKIDWDRDEVRRPLKRGGEPRTIAEVLAELLGRCQERFPEADRAGMPRPAATA